MTKMADKDVLMELTVRNSDSTGGWAAELMEAGFRVQWSPAPFGETRYTVKSASDSIQFVQAPTRRRKFRIDAMTSGQMQIIDALMSARVLA